jgi:hypothetical protein
VQTIAPKSLIVPFTILRPGPHMTLVSVGALFTLGALAHNAEEAVLLPAWSSRGGRWYKPVSRPHFAFAVSVVSLMVLAFALGAYVQGPRSLSAYLFCGYAFAAVANTIVPHLAMTVATRTYMPGTATALLLTLPLGTLFLLQAVEVGFVEPSRLVWAAPTVAGCLGLSLPVLFGIARRLMPSSGRAT